jgi:hypothetical protein
MQQSLFVKECALDPNRFEQSISRVKISNFALEGMKVKQHISNKITVIKKERDLRGRMLCLALDKKVDIGVVLSRSALTVCSNVKSTGELENFLAVLLMEIAPFRNSSSIPGCVSSIFNILSWKRTSQRA